MLQVFSGPQLGVAYLSPHPVPQAPLFSDSPALPVIHGRVALSRIAFFSLDGDMR